MSGRERRGRSLCEGEEKDNNILDPVLPTRRDASLAYTQQPRSYTQYFISYCYVLFYESTCECTFTDFLCVLVAV